MTAAARLRAALAPCEVRWWACAMTVLVLLTGCEEVVVVGGFPVEGVGSSAGVGANAGQAGEPAKPVAIRLEKSIQEAVWQTLSGGEEFADTCPVDQILIGVEGTTERPPGFVRSVHGVCGEVVIVNGSTPGKFEVQVVQGVVLPDHGAPDSNTQAALCSPDQFVTGFSGSSGGLIDSLQMRCASLVIAGSTPDFELFVRAEGSRGMLGGSGGERFEPTECPPDQVAYGQIVRMAEAATAFGVQCTTPSLIVQ